MLLSSSDGRGSASWERCPFQRGGGEALNAALSPDLGLQVRGTQKAGPGAIGAYFLDGNDLVLLISVTE